MHKVLHIAFLIITAYLLFSCAKQNNAGPSGGPEDKTPPVVVEAEPVDKSINFDRKEFEITFDEYFVLDNVDQKLMISPPFDKKPVISTKGKKLIVSFEEELRDSITYTFYFMDAVRDLNEGNAIENFQYVFSTGPTLDSLSVTGTIYDARTLDSGEEIFVTLYANLSDTAPATSLPDYITRAGSDGKFRINNIAEGEYAIYGLIDNNNNKIYDLDDEIFAFIDSTISLSGANNYIPEMPDSLATAADSAKYLSIPGKEYKLFYFQGQSKTQYLVTTARDEAYKLMFVFKQALDTGQFAINFIDSIDVRYSMEMLPGKDTVVIWLLDSLAYKQETLSLSAEYPETDSSGTIIITTDTLSFRYYEPRPQRGKRETARKGLNVRNNVSSPTGFKPGSDILFFIDTPLDDPDTSLIDLYVKSDTNMLPLTYTLLKDSTSNKKLILKYQFEEDSVYMLIYDKGAFSDIFGNINDSATLSFKVNNRESYGTLTMRLSGYNENIILQLINSKDIVVKENYLTNEEPAEIFYPLLEKGEYTVKAIFDLDGNGKWTTGDYYSRRQPEPVSFYPGIIDIKVQWDLVQDWEINEFNYKNEQMREQKKASGK